MFVPLIVLLTDKFPSHFRLYLREKANIVLFFYLSFSQQFSLLFSFNFHRKNIVLFSVKQSQRAQKQFCERAYLSFFLLLRKRQENCSNKFRQSYLFVRCLFPIDHRILTDGYLLIKMWSIMSKTVVRDDEGLLYLRTQSTVMYETCFAIYFIF